VAGIYLMLNAEFLAAVQVLIYVGAITILMLFAIMLTYHIQSQAAKQTNEKVIPAALISLVFLGLAIFSLTRTFGDVDPVRQNTGAWTAAIDAKKLLAKDRDWNWTALLEDKTGKNYYAFGHVALVPQLSFVNAGGSAPEENKRATGYILSANSNYSTSNVYFDKSQTIYLKIWSDDVDNRQVSNAVWKLTSQTDTAQVITANLSNSNPEVIGQLMMSTYVLPFEVVSILLLAALIGAIVISRKDK
jgi:NADH:ubiquinone oxidoreductase subunit 6 (subunit J)